MMKWKQNKINNLPIVSHSQEVVAVKVNPVSLGPELVFLTMILFENCSNSF